MITKKITLPTIADVKEFMSVMINCPVEADLTSGRYQVDAKSIMGIFSLDLSSPVKLHFHTEDKDEIDATLLQISKFILE